jgi:hypothetical protein
VQEYAHGGRPIQNVPKCHTRGGWWEELEEDRLIVMAGMESMERSQTYQTYWKLCSINSIQGHENKLILL